MGSKINQDEAPVYVLERQPYPERGESRYVIWVKEDGMKISPVKLSQLLADVLQGQVRVIDLVATNPADSLDVTNPPSNPTNVNRKG